jgi:hypothetical protein
MLWKIGKLWNIVIMDSSYNVHLYLLWQIKCGLVKCGAFNRQVNKYGDIYALTILYTCGLEIHGVIQSKVVLSTRNTIYGAVLNFWLP